MGQSQASAPTLETRAMAHAMTKGKFNIAATSKRPASDTPQAPSKIPRAAECTLVEKGPKPQTSAKRFPAHAPVTLCIYKVTDQACDVWNVFEDKPDVKLFQVQIEHAAKPSISYFIVDKFNSFLRTMHARDETIPASLTDLQQKAGIKLVVTDRQDPDEIGFQQWRVAFYIAGSEISLKNFLYLFDSFLMLQSECMAREKQFEVHVYPHIGIDIADAREHFSFEHYIMNDPALKLPLGIFEAQPVTGKKIVQIHIQPESADTMSVLLTGTIWNFRSRLDAHGVAGAYYGADETRKYIRLLKSIDVSEEAQQKRVTDMVTEVFKNLAIKVILDDAPEEESEVAEFVEKLHEISSLHFADPKVDVAPTP